MTTETAVLDIIRAGHEHLDLVAPLFDAYRVFYTQASDVEGARAFLRDRVVAGDSAIFLAMSDDNGARAAMGFAQLYPTLSSISLRRVWILNDLYVDPAHRRAGVAKALMIHATEFARRTGAVRLALSTALDNAPAKRLYESTGWKRDARFDHYTLSLEG